MTRRAPPRRILGLALFLVLSLTAALGSALVEVPRLHMRVTDQADMISPYIRERIEQRLKHYGTVTGHQFALVTLDSLDGEDIQSFGERLAQDWQRQDAAREDGLLLIISQEARDIHVQVGPGLKSVITAKMTRAIIDAQMRPAFRIRDYDSGVSTALETLMRAARGDALSEERGWAKLPIPFWWHVLAASPLLLFLVFSLLVLFRSPRPVSEAGMASAPLFRGAAALTVSLLCSLEVSFLWPTLSTSSLLIGQAGAVVVLYLALGLGCLGRCVALSDTGAPQGN